MWMNAPMEHSPVILMPTVLTLLAVSYVIATLDTLGMVSLVKVCIRNEYIIQIVVMLTDFLTPVHELYELYRAHRIVINNVFLAPQTSMNVKTQVIILLAMKMPTALTLRVVMSVPATLDSLEMDSLAQVRIPLIFLSFTNIHKIYLFYLYPTDINECELDMDQCAPNATCYNTEGSYECNCNTGFTGSGTSCCTYVANYSMVE